MPVVRGLMDGITGMARLEPHAIHVIRAPLLKLFASRLEGMGAPVDHLLDRAGISAELLDFPDTLVPLANAFQFLELTCSALGTEHAGLHVGLSASLADFGDYGRSLANSATVSAYLERGARYYNCLNRGERLWLSSVDGRELRVNFSSSGGHPLGAYQSHLSTLIVTILTLRQAAGPGWCPRELGLAYHPREPAPLSGLLPGARILYGMNHSYITLPAALTRMRFPRASGRSHASETSPGRPLPTDIVDIVLSQIEALYNHRGAPHIDEVADSLAMSRRTLQRQLGGRCTTYCDILNQSRMRRARDWLDHSDRSVTEIAFDLGYTDASNFTRAFRRHTGLSPSDFRRQAAVG